MRQEGRDEGRFGEDWGVYGCFGGMGRFGGEDRKWGNLTKDFSRVGMA